MSGPSGTTSQTPGTESFEGPRYFISELSFCAEGGSIEDAQDTTNALIEWAESHGLKLIGGSTGTVREDKPVENVSYASTEIFRNRMAEQGMALSHATDKDAPGRS
jgi:hydrogenase maturation factor